jgi:adenine-specific DNA methylase
MPDSPRDDTAPPIARGFPIARVNDLAERESRAKLYYRPLSVLHKWWARRLGSVFRTVCLYSLVDDPGTVSVSSPGNDGTSTLADFTEDADAGVSSSQIAQMIENVSLETPDALWELYPQDVSIDDKRVLDPFMGAGTTLLEAVRFGVTATGVDLNPVAWFITKKALEASSASPDELRTAFDDVEKRVADELRSHYRTGCPNDDHEADVTYGFWVRELDCVSCGHTVPLFKDYRVASGRYDDSDRDNVLCPDCGSVFLTSDYRETAVCPDCSCEFTPADGPVSRGGNYGCPECGQKYAIVDAIAEGQSYRERLYALEYYCTECEDAGHNRPTYKGYKPAADADRDRYDDAAKRLAGSTELSAYIPDEAIPKGAVTQASSISGNDVFQHGFETWADMFNSRQQYGLATLLQAIDEVDNDDAREFLLLAFSNTLQFQNNFARFNTSGAKVESIFGQNSFFPPVEYVENNPWGTRAGRGTFTNTWEHVLDAVEWAHEPVERYLDDGEMQRTEPFDTPVGGDTKILQGDIREVDIDGEFDAVITDLPFYDNVVYSELSDFFYVWQRQLLADEYDSFGPSRTPHQQSIVANPAIGADDDKFEEGLSEAFERLNSLLADDGTLVFTYRHEGPHSWAGLLKGLCGAGFDVTATYPISAGLSEFTAGEELNFGVVVVARPAEEREAISWNALRRRLFQETKRVQEQLEAAKTLSAGDESVVQMGACFEKYSTHFGQVHNRGELMDTEAIVNEILDLVTGTVDVTDVYLTLLSMDEPTKEDLVRLCRGTTIDPDDLREREMILDDDGFEIAGWTTDARQTYIEECPAEARSDLDTLQRLRAFAAEDTPIRLNDARSSIDVTSSLLDLADRLATETNDDTYRELLN